MGQQFNVYVGPCFEVPAKKTVVLGSVLACANGHPVKGKGPHLRYCSQCAAEIKERPLAKEVNAPPRVLDLPENLSDIVWAPETPQLNPANCALWLPNEKGFGVTFREGQVPETMPFLDLAGTVAAVELSRFTHRLKPVADFAKEKLQVELKPRFLAVPYWS